MQSRQPPRWKNAFPHGNRVYRQHASEKAASSTRMGTGVCSSFWMESWLIDTVRPFLWRDAVASWTRARITKFLVIP